MKKKLPGAASLRADIARVLLASAALSPLALVAPAASAQQAPQSLFTTNQDSVGASFDAIAIGLFNSQFNPTAAQREFMDQYDSFFGGEGGPNVTVEEYAVVLDELGAFEFDSLRTVTTIFSQSQFESTRDRLSALRKGGSATTAGINLRSGEFLSSSERRLGGGAAADGGLMSNRLGVWIRGNSGSGEKEVTTADRGFDADQTGFTAGIDYRYGPSFVAGAAVGYGTSEVKLNRNGGGSSIDIDSLALSLYGSAYFGDLYVDVVGNYIKGDYESKRRVNYVDGFGDTIDQTFSGSTDGSTISAALAVGYDLTFGGFALTPSFGYQYVDVQIDAFREAENAPTAPGWSFNMGFDEQTYKSSTANIALNATYAFGFSWGVLIPHVRASYVREFENDIQVLGMRFANDPFANAANPSPPITVQSDEIDDTYARVAAGLSAQFKGNLSGYVEYQRIESLDHLEFQDFTLGVRMQF